MNRRKWRILLWSVCGLAAAFFGFLYFCQDSGGEQKRHIIFISKVIDEENDFWKLLIDGVKMAAAENKIELSVVGMENEDNYEGQHELIQGKSRMPSFFALPAIQRPRPMQRRW